MVSIKGLNKAKVLATLHNNSTPIGMGKILFVERDLRIKDASERLSDSRMIYNFNGRVIGANFSYDTLDPDTYDMYNGKNAMKCNIARLRRMGSVIFSNSSKRRCAVHNRY